MQEQEWKWSHPPCGFGKFIRSRSMSSRNPRRRWAGFVLVHLVALTVLPGDAQAFRLSDVFDFGIETDGPCFRNAAEIDGTLIDVGVSSADGGAEGFGPLIAFAPDSRFEVQFRESDGSCTGSPFSVDLCVVDQWADPSAINAFLRSLDETHRWQPGQLANVAFDPPYDGDTVHFSGSSFTIVVSAGAFDGALYFYPAPCRVDFEGSFDDIDLSHYADRAAMEQAEQLPMTL